VNDDDSPICLIDEQPDHGCDLCSRFRRRAVYHLPLEIGSRDEKKNNGCRLFL
jgi:hypothetical protein